MVTKLNLASQPFRNRTLPWTIAVVVAAVSLLVIVYTVTESRRVAAQADIVDRDLQKLRQERNALEAQATRVRDSVPPDQLKVLEAAHLLVERKGFSWSKLLSDLESSLPASVRVSRINVRDVALRGGQTRAELELTVIGRTPADVTDMITEMSREGTFNAVPLTERPLTGRGESGIEWTLRVGYVQRPGRRPAATGGGERDESANVATRATPEDSPEETP